LRRATDVGMKVWSERDDSFATMAGMRVDARTRLDFRNASVAATA